MKGESRSDVDIKKGSDKIKEENETNDDEKGSEGKVDVKEGNETNDKKDRTVDADEIKTKSEKLDIKRETLKDGTIFFSTLLLGYVMMTDTCDMNNHRYHR